MRALNILPSLIPRLSRKNLKKKLLKKLRVKPPKISKKHLGINSQRREPSL
ncbi:Hypothetical protein Cp87MAT_1203 [Corynebacterium pseudotuberculosis]|nr:Hypothetical protein Cp12C_1556 [Corynebacterium pseudotuberculosis]ALP34144.1 Hypothetical protein CpN1_1470 [Corynebacterium pseudotuberculosis]ANH26240.1 Hypothetical protein CpMEX9_1474 [Corynebacterium pseudotuberculosis]QBB99595.1 Hypothetical protein Cp87MAT_1203 [Corynebacterium pseudotuberculosis]QBI73398.1 Hypothetical protein Cp38MAT_1517 [Corynebacterium pseudotuberculosis]